mmetsp:Transcript_68561/g.193406  ORF Transcript_68561/g.193406 Transcript_68561/m.193406 type:complete len:271 (+) Transcript_68561:749-1561(+)
MNFASTQPRKRIGKATARTRPSAAPTRKSTSQATRVTSQPRPCLKIHFSGPVPRARMARLAFAPAPSPNSRRADGSLSSASALASSGSTVSSMTSPCALKLARSDSSAPWKAASSSAAMISTSRSTSSSSTPVAPPASISAKSSERCSSLSSVRVALSMASMAAVLSIAPFSADETAWPPSPASAASFVARSIAGSARRLSYAAPKSTPRAWFASCFPKPSTMLFATCSSVCCVSELVASACAGWEPSVFASWTARRTYFSSRTIWRILR